jgi:hypothetical protein
MPLPDNDHNRPFQPEKSRLNNYETSEKAAEAKALLDNPVLQGAMLDIYSRAAGTLVKEDVGSLTAGAAHAMMKSVLDLQAQLEEYISDDKMRQKYNKGDT